MQVSVPTIPKHSNRTKSETKSFMINLIFILIEASGSLRLCNGSIATWSVGPDTRVKFSQRCQRSVFGE